MHPCKSYAAWLKPPHMYVYIHTTNIHTILTDIRHTATHTAYETHHCTPHKYTHTPHTHSHHTHTHHIHTHHSHTHHTHITHSHTHTHSQTHTHTSHTLTHTHPTHTHITHTHTSLTLTLTHTHTTHTHTLTLTSHTLTHTHTHTALPGRPSHAGKLLKPQAGTTQVVAHPAQSIRVSPAACSAADLSMSSGARSPKPSGLTPPPPSRGRQAPL